MHGVPVRYRTLEVAEDIGCEVGEVALVKKGAGEDCVGRFLRVCVRLDVSQPLLRMMIVPFPGVGERSVDFQYEYLPEFCQECGLLGHPTRVCDERLGIKNKKEEERPYQGSLRAERDLHGRRLGPRGGKGRFQEGRSGSEASGSFSGSFSRSMGDGNGERTEAGVREGSGALLLEGPLNDTASSPVKEVVLQPKSKGVLIAERFVAQQRALREGKEHKSADRVLFPAISEVKEGAREVDVEMTTVQLSKKLLLTSSAAIGDSDIKRLGGLLQASFSKEVVCGTHVMLQNSKAEQKIEGIGLGGISSPF